MRRRWAAAGGQGQAGLGVAPRKTKDVVEDRIHNLLDLAIPITIPHSHLGRQSLHCLRWDTGNLALYLCRKIVLTLTTSVSCLMAAWVLHSLNLIISFDNFVSSRPGLGRRREVFKPDRVILVVSALPEAAIPPLVSQT
jgi:hypothetical protein